jgi:aminoglycoside 6-adenylyltransferase
VDEGAGVSGRSGGHAAVVAEFLDRLAAWGAASGDVAAVLLVGSQAREVVPADEFSDVDVALLVADTGPYLAGADWLSAFGEPLLTFLEPTAVGTAYERRALFTSGLEVDFSILPAEALAAMAADAQTASVLARGFRVLAGDPALEQQLRAAAANGAERPPLEPAAFTALSHDLWYHVLLAAKKLARGEIWLARSICDCYLKGRLVQLFAWHVETRDPGRDTWHGGRFLEQWADTALVDELWGAYAADRADVAGALRRTADLAGRIESDLAAALGLPEPVDRAAVRERLDALLAR